MGKKTGARPAKRLAPEKQLLGPFHPKNVRPGHNLRETPTRCSWEQTLQWPTQREVKSTQQRASLVGAICAFAEQLIPSI